MRILAAMVMAMFLGGAAYADTAPCKATKEDAGEIARLVEDALAQASAALERSRIDPELAATLEASIEEAMARAEASLAEAEAQAAAYELTDADQEAAEAQVEEALARLEAALAVHDVDCERMQERIEAAMERARAAVELAREGGLKFGTSEGGGDGGRLMGGPIM